MEDRIKKFEFPESETGSKLLIRQVQETMLSRRKEKLNQILQEKRKIFSSNQNQLHQKMDIEEDLEDPMSPELKNLTMNQLKKCRRKRKGKRCK